MTHFSLSAHCSRKLFCKELYHYWAACLTVPKLLALRCIIYQQLICIALVWLFVSTSIRTVLLNTATGRGGDQDVYCIVNIPFDMIACVQCTIEPWFKRSTHWRSFLLSLAQQFVCGCITMACRVDCVYTIICYIIVCLIHVTICNKHHSVR